MFERRLGAANGAAAGGHVGFWTAESSSHISLLGGNQSNRVCVANYPKSGTLGGNFYRLLSVRRA